MRTHTHGVGWLGVKYRQVNQAACRWHPARRLPEEAGQPGPATIGRLTHSPGTGAGDTATASEPDEVRPGSLHGFTVEVQQNLLAEDGQPFIPLPAQAGSPLGGLFVGVCLLLLWGSPLLQAATFYVSTSGFDGNSCMTAQTITTPKATIQSALNCLGNPGDTLYIRAGTYSEGVRITSTANGTPSQSIVIAGYPGDARPVIDIPPSWNAQGFIVDWRASHTPYYWTLRDFDIEGINQTYPSACLALSGPNVTVDNLVIRNCPRDGIQAFSQSLTVRNSSILNCGRDQPPADTDTKGVGIYFSLDDDPANGGIGGDGVFEDNVIDGCRAGGVVIHYDTYNTIVRRNILRNFGLDSPWSPPSGFQQYGTGVTIGGAGTLGTTGPMNTLVYNNLIAHGSGVNGNAQCFILWGSQDNFLVNNTCYDVNYGVENTTRPNFNITIQNNIWSAVDQELVSSVTLTGPFDHNLLNPNVPTTFVNAATNDFHLIAGSPAVDVGTSESSLFTTDYANVTRPQGAAWDIGAYEFGAAGTPPTVAITAPTSTPTYTVTASPLTTLAGTAGDTGGTVTGITWVNAAGGSGSATCSGCPGASVTWSVASITLISGANVITVTATDNDSNTTNDVLTVTLFTPDIIGHWPLEEAIGTMTADATGKGHTGTLNGSLVAGVAGRVGNAMLFDNVDDYANIPYVADLGITAEITIAAWVKLTALGGYNPLLAKTNGTTEWDWELLLNASNQLVFYADGASPTSRTSTGTITDLNWHHVAATRDGADLVTLYLDGVSIGSGTMANAFQNRSHPVRIGTDGPTYSAASLFDGILDEVRLYNYALTGAAVAALGAVTVTAPSLIAVTASGFSFLSAPIFSSAAMAAPSIAGTPVLSSATMAAPSFVGAPTLSQAVMP